MRNGDGTDALRRSVCLPPGDDRMDEDDSRKDEDRAFILRLPPDRAREVRQMLADNNFQDIRLHVDPAADSRINRSQGIFKGRTGNFSMVAPGTSDTVRLPLTVLDLPTMIESYRTIDGKSGDYVKTADVSQVFLHAQCSLKHSFKNKFFILLSYVQHMPIFRS